MAFLNNYKGMAVFDGTSQTLEGKQLINTAVWMGYSSGNELAVESDGVEVARVSAGANGKIELPQLCGYWADDLTVTVIGGGKLYVHYA